MEIIITKSDWGMEGMGDTVTRLQLVADAGFYGIECFFVDMEPARFTAQRADLELKFVGGFVAPNPGSFAKVWRAYFNSTRSWSIVTAGGTITPPQRRSPISPK